MKNLDAHELISLLGQGNPKAFNEFCLHYQRKQIQKKQTRNTTENELLTLSPDDNREEIALEKIRFAITRLPKKQRVVFVLFYLNDLPIREISEILRIPLGTVKSRLYYGREMMKKRLKQIKQ